MLGNNALTIPERWLVARQLKMTVVVLGEKRSCHTITIESLGILSALKICVILRSILLGKYLHPSGSKTNKFASQLPWQSET